LFLQYLGSQEIAIILILVIIIIVVVVSVVNAVKKREQRQKEALKAMNDSKGANVNVQNNSNVRASDPNLRIEAIRNLKEIGKPFDEYDVELEIEKIKSCGK
jgi:flagellar biosynthesis/type III secretory pathway M-ring protein FliF/YscJ